MEKSAQSRSISNIVSPLRYIGKKYLSTRSDIYKDTLDVVIKADNIFRDIIRKQKNYLKMLNKDKGRLEAVKFAQDTSAFMREQAVLVEIVGLIRNKFAEKVGVNPEELKDLNYYISSEIGKSPEYNPNQVVETKINVEQEWDVERPSSIKRWLDYYTKTNDDWTRLDKDEEKTAIEKNPELISKAFLASWFWGKTQSGKEMKQAFDIIYSNMANMLNSNLSILKTLDGLRSQGDPQGYWFAVKGKNGFGGIYKKFVEDNEKFVTAWKKFEDIMYQSMKSEDASLEDKDEEIESEAPEVEYPEDYDEEDVRYSD